MTIHFSLLRFHALTTRSIIMKIGTYIVQGIEIPIYTYNEYLSHPNNARKLVNNKTS